MHISRRVILAIIPFVLVVLFGLLWIFFIGDSSFWSSKVSIIFIVLGVLVALLQWLFPFSSENYKVASSIDTSKQGLAELHLSERAKEDRQKAVEQERKLKSKQKRRRIVIGCSIALSIVFAGLLVYLQFSSYIYSGRLDCCYTFPTRSITALAWSPDGTLLAIVTDDGQVRLWNKAKDQSITIDQTGTTINSVSWSSDNKHIAYGGNDNKVTILDATTGLPSPTSFELSDTVFAIAWSPTNSKYIAFGGADKTVQVWNLMNNKKPIFIYHENGILRALAWSHDGNDLASADDDGKLHVWNATTGTNLFTNPGYIDSVTALRWSPLSNSLLASASSDDQVRVWDTTKKGFTENPVHAYKDYTGGVNDIDWSPNGNYIAVTDKGGMLHIWDWSASPQKDISSFRFYFSSTYYNPNFELTAVAWSLDTSSIAIGEKYSANDGNDFAAWTRIVVFCKQWCFQGL